MKTVITSLLTVLLAATLIFALPAAGEESVFDDTLRLHVLAASDSTADQTAKLLVRDAVLEKYGAAFNQSASKESAVTYVRENLVSIKEYLESMLSTHGLSYQVNVALKEEWFDTRTYDEITLPCGVYTALTVTLGEGRGQNFFCMLYPALCTAPALGDKLNIAEESYDEEAYRLVTGNYAIRFRTLEILSALFGG